jgi:tripartite-type tricarboxylate transporter receptor subunit TctC
MKHVAPILAAALCASSPVNADPYPLAQIHVIVPNATASWADVAGRIVLDRMGKLLGTTFLTVNRPKALGTIGLDECAQAEPNGYTICQANYGHIVALAATGPAAGAARPYDVAQRLVPIGEIADTQYVLMTSADVPARTLSEFIAYARSVPGKLSFATHGPSSVLIEKILESALSVEFVEVPYIESNEPQAMNDLLAGRVQVKVGAISTVQSHRDGVHVLGVFGGEGRSKFFPEVPSMLELGYTGFGVIASWTGLWAPLKTPPEVVQKLNAALVEALKDPEVSKLLNGLGMEPRPGTPEMLQKLHDPVEPLAAFMKQHNIVIFGK